MPHFTTDSDASARLLNNLTYLYALYLAWEKKPAESQSGQLMTRHRPIALSAKTSVSSLSPASDALLNSVKLTTPSLNYVIDDLPKVEERIWLWFVSARPARA